MQLGISTASYFNKRYVEDAVTDIARHGVPLCEIFLNTFSEYGWDFAKRLKQRVDDAGISVYSVHPMSTQFEPQLFSVLDRQLSDARDLFEKVLALGQLLGATHYVMHGPPRLAGAAKNIQIERIAPLIVEYAALSRQYGIQLLLENVSYCVFSSPEYARELIARIPPDTLRFTLDIKQALRSGFDPLDYLDAMRGALGNVHLCGASKRPDGTYALAMPGRDGYDFAGLFSAIQETGYTGPAFIEVYSDMYQTSDELYDSYRYLRALLSAPRVSP